MIAKWYNTNAALAAGMVGISSADIRNFSRGAVSRVCDGEKEGEALEGSLEDPAIFGRLEDQELWMGHIELPQPVANIQYPEFATFSILASKKMSKIQPLGCIFLLFVI